MNDETKAAVEALRRVLEIKGVLEPLRGVLITRGTRRLLLAWIDGEPARLAAAREEQREMDVRSCPTCKGEGFTMRVRECPFCDDSTHDHECPTDEVKVYCLCGAARIRAAPLTATPLADKIAALREDLASALADRDEAIAALRQLDGLRAARSKRLLDDEEWRRASDVLAKHPEGE